MQNSTGRTLWLAFCGMLILSCGDQPNRRNRASADGAVALALKVAQEYVDGYYHQFPEEAFMYGYPGAPADRFSDYSQGAIAGWQEREDGWIRTLRSIDAIAIRGTAGEVPYAFVLDRLEASRDLRVCRFELWTMSPAWLGWYESLPANFIRQTVGTDKARAAVLARAGDVARYIETDIANLREGLSLGFVAPKSRIEELLQATSGLVEGTLAESPFFDPAVRDGTEEFAASLLAMVDEEINPAVRRYCDFLRNEYLPVARESIAVTDTPGAAACYTAVIRFHTSLTPSPEEIHETGLREMDRLHEEIRVIGRRSFGIDEPANLLQHIRTAPDHRFTSEQEILDYARAAVDRGRAAAPGWFGFVPEAEVVVTPYPDYLRLTGAGMYTAGSPDGSSPARYEIGTHDPKGLGRAGIEATAFHETYPGHHLQQAVALENQSLHPVLRYLWISGTGEGWAVYSERLADEIGLYTSDVARVGQLSTEARFAARLVVDPGMHAFGWTRQQAIDYLLENTSLSEGEAIYEIDRYIAFPAQAVSYMIGSLEIQRLRRLAEERLGDRFDIRSFHDAVIEDGAVTLEMLRRKIEAWIESEERR